MASSDGPSHLLSLKVMRVSRPALASAWQPFYSSSPSFSAHSTEFIVSLQASFSAHSTESIVSLQGKDLLPGHPKTLRDLTQATELLTLPASFGSIQLGETFSSCLCVNNEATTEIDAVSLRVEMQTATSKVVLAEFGGPNTRMQAGDTIENVVHHEIKELGQHVLACTVSYRFPASVRGAPPHDGTNDTNLLSFRKFYKFAVTNPLSVKTKVHAPRSASAMMIPTERDKVFLEVHIQNLTSEPIWFERMFFECADGWNVQDVNNIDVDSGEEQSLYSGSTALMQPQDLRQYIYILSPKVYSLEPPVYTPGTIIPLGRLDISWRSSYGEPGRLLTSMLTRKIPLPPQPPQAPPASALPPYLKRTVPSASISRSHSPQLSQSRPVSPTPVQRPGSPFRNRASSIVSLRTQTPPPPPLPLTPAPPHIEANLVVRDIPRKSISVEKRFSMALTLILSSPLIPERQNQHLRLSLIIQHLYCPSSSVSKLIPPEAAAGQATEPSFSPRLSTPGFSTPSPVYTTFNYGLAHQKLLAASDRQSNNGVSAADVPTPQSHVEKTSSLPPPFFERVDESKRKQSAAITFYGPSAIALPAIELQEKEVTTSGTVKPGEAERPSSKLYATHDFELSFIPLRRGFTAVGGLRLLLAEEKYVDKNGDVVEEPAAQRVAETRQVLKEWDVIGEVWIS